MKKILFLIAAFLLTFNGIAQKKADFNENDVKQFYRTIEGVYTGWINDSTSVTLHFTPIWEREGDMFHWLYMEAVNKNTKKIVAQNILEIKPLTSITFNVIVYGIKSPDVFAGKWGNRNFFDGFNKGILKGKKKFVFIKTKDFEYQTGWNRPSKLKCFPSGDRVHFKFVQGEESLYVKRIPKRTSDIIGITFIKAPID